MTVVVWFLVVVVMLRWWSRSSYFAFRFITVVSPAVAMKGRPQVPGASKSRQVNRKPQRCMYMITNENGIAWKGNSWSDGGPPQANEELTPLPLPSFRSLSPLSSWPFFVRGGVKVVVEANAVVWCKVDYCVKYSGGYDVKVVVAVFKMVVVAVLKWWLSVMVVTLFGR